VAAGNDRRAHITLDRRAISPLHHTFEQSDGRGQLAVSALVIVALAAIWLVAFIVSNSEHVRVSFAFGHVRVSLIWVMIICAALGAVLAWGIPRFSRR
jgi:uncharacterized integral membrane protein